MPRQNNRYDGGYTPTQTVRQIAEGGTGSSSIDTFAAQLGGLTKDVLDEPGGVAVAGIGGFVKPKYISSTFVLGATLKLASTLTAATQAQYEITNYDVGQEYLIEFTPNVPWFISTTATQAFLNFTPPANGEYKLSINGKEYYFTVGSAKPNKPVIVSPTASQLNISDRFLFVNSGYTDPGGTPYSKTQWQVSATSSFTTTPIDSTEITAIKQYLATGIKTTFGAGVSLFVRCRFKNKAGIYSDWSDTVAFSTVADFTPNLNIGTIASSGVNAFGRKFVVGPNEDFFIVYDALYKDPANMGTGYDGSLTFYDRDGMTILDQIKFQRSNFPVAVDHCAMVLSGDGLTLALAVRSFDAGSDKNNVMIFTVDKSKGKLGKFQTVTTFDETANAAANYKLSLAISDDATYIAVGSPGSIVSSVLTGAVVILTRGAGQYSRQAILTRTSAVAGDKIGTAVALNSDGTVLMYSRQPTGVANQNLYQQTRSISTWSISTSLTENSSQHIDDGFGSVLTMAGPATTPKLVVGAPGYNSNVGIAFIFTRSGTTWSGNGSIVPTGSPAGAKFPTSLKLSNDGSFVIAGCENITQGGNASAGAAYVYGTASGTSALATLAPPTPAVNGKFGAHVYLNATGALGYVGECVFDTANVGAAGPGKIHRYA